MPLVTPAVALLLVAAPLAAAAQGRPMDAAGPVVPRSEMAPRFEAAASASLIAIFPGFGGLVTVPAGRRLSLEVGVETYPWVIEDGDEARVLTQVQARIPWAVRPGARRSVVVGVTAATMADQRWSGGWEFQTNYFPHGGVSWQWQKSQRFDLRLDVTAMVALASMPVPVPKVQVSTVWHTKRSPR
jgi:hypothetical protein